MGIPAAGAATPGADELLAGAAEGAGEPAGTPTGVVAFTPVALEGTAAGVVTEPPAVGGASGVGPSIAPEQPAS